MGPFDDDKLETKPSLGWQLSSEGCGPVRKHIPAPQPERPHEYTHFEFTIIPDKHIAEFSFILPDGVSGVSILEDIQRRNSRHAKMWNACNLFSDPTMQETQGERKFSFTIYYQAYNLDLDRHRQLMELIDRDLTKFSVVALAFILYADSLNFNHIGSRSIEEIFLKRFKIQTDLDLLTCFGGVLVRIPWIPDRKDSRVVPAGSLKESQLDKR